VSENTGDMYCICPASQS